jgi:CTP:molybdopterin cytidylyltransferase MocA
MADGASPPEPTPTLVPEPDAQKPPAVDPKDLAKMLAKAAAARGKAPRPAAPEAPGNPTPAPAESRPTIGRLATAPPPGRSKPAAELVAEGSRLAAAPPPVRKKSASEVLDELARQPEPEPMPVVAPPAEAAPRPAPKPATVKIPATNQGDGDWVPALLLQQLPMLAGATVAKVLLVEDREAQKALWKGHRARFLATGDVGHGLAVAAVLHALGQAPAGELAVARLVTGDRDWLVWVERRSCIAAFPNASLWFNGI